MRILGLVTSLVGLLGYGVRVEWGYDLEILKVLALFYFLTSIEIAFHFVYISFEPYHVLSHFLLVLTSLTIGTFYLKGAKVSMERSKELLIYGALVWLINKHFDPGEVDPLYVFIALCSIVTSILSIYTLLSVKRLGVFFSVPEEFLSVMYGVIFMIGLSTFCMSSLPLVLVAFLIAYTMAKMAQLTKPLI